VPRSQKKEENSKRLRYVRVLERFTRSCANYLMKSENLTKEGFDKKVDNNAKYLHRVERITLYKGEFSELEAIADALLAFRHSDEAVETIRSTILYAFNQLEKNINRRKYKKDKHGSKKFEEWE